MSISQNIAKVSKGIAGLAGAIAAVWVSHFTGLTVPGEAVAWVEGMIVTGVAGALGFFITFISPKNRE